LPIKLDGQTSCDVVLFDLGWKDQLCGGTSLYLPQYKRSGLRYIMLSEMHTKSESQAQLRDIGMHQEKKMKLLCSS
jgi:hypothetical protein